MAHRRQVQSNQGLGVLQLHHTVEFEALLRQVRHSLVPMALPADREHRMLEPKARQGH